MSSDLINKKTCILIGGGASLTKHIESGLWEAIKGKDIWSLNFGFKFMPYLPNRECWVDSSFFRKNLVDLQELSSKGVPFFCKKSEYYTAFTFINQYNTFREINKPPLPLPSDIFIGNMGLVGTFALSLAIYEQYDRIFLFGYDFGTRHYTDNLTHFYQDKAKELAIQSSGVGNSFVYFNGENIKHSVLDFDYYKQFNKEIYNVSTVSNIKSFPVINYNEFLTQLNLTKQA